MTLANLDGDGDLDLLFCSGARNDVAWVASNGSGVFGPVVDVGGAVGAAVRRDVALDGRSINGSNVFNKPLSASVEEMKSCRPRLPFLSSWALFSRRAVRSSADSLAHSPASDRVSLRNVRNIARRVVTLVAARLTRSSTMRWRP